MKKILSIFSMLFFMLFLFASSVYAEYGEGAIFPPGETGENYIEIKERLALMSPESRTTLKQLVRGDPNFEIVDLTEDWTKRLPSEIVKRFKRKEIKLFLILIVPGFPYQEIKKTLSTLSQELARCGFKCIYVDGPTVVFCITTVFFKQLKEVVSEDETESSDLSDDPGFWYNDPDYPSFALSFESSDYESSDSESSDYESSDFWSDDHDHPDDHHDHQDPDPFPDGLLIFDYYK